MRIGTWKNGRRKGTGKRKAKDGWKRREERDREKGDKAEE